MNETAYPSLAARRRLYAEIVKEYYKEKKAKAKVSPAFLLIPIL